MNTKRFHKCDELIFQFDVVSYPIKEHPTFIRQCVAIHASAGATWQDISKEIHDRGRSGLNGVLLTCMVDCEEMVVGLTAVGAQSIIRSSTIVERDPVAQHYAYFEKVDQFAKEMVANRDHSAHMAEAYKNNEEATKKYADFWPK